MTTPLLDVRNLSVDFDTRAGAIHALRGASIKVNAGEVVGIAGESGSAKSTLVSAIMGLLHGNAHVFGEGIFFRGEDLLAAAPLRRRALRGSEIAMVFQDPMTAFNPVFSIGEQLKDFQHQIKGLSSAQKLERACDMLQKAGVADPALCLTRFAHELSGGMRQRVAIAAALLMRPHLLLADEPTTALDVTMEAQIIHLLRELRHEIDGGIIVVTHHLGVIAELCDRAYVMYAGQIVEEGLVDDIYHRPSHPYTRALIACDPTHIEQAAHLPTIPGRVPDLAHPPQGCSFAARCSLASEKCRTQPPPWVQVSQAQGALCHEAKP